MSESSFPLKKLPLTSSDVCLVSMPYSDLFLPSLALGLLKAVLVEAGIKVNSIYGYLLFAEQLGVKEVQRIHLKDPRFPLDEWAFSSTAFPEHHVDEDHFIHEVYAVGKARWQSKEEFREEMRFVRQQADEFTNRLAEYVINLSPKVVGCSSSVSQRVPSLALLRRIRELNPKVITVLGGADCNAGMGQKAHENFTWIDYVLSGEAEDVLVPLIKGIFRAGRHMTIEDIPAGVLAPIHREMGYPSPVPRVFAGSFSQQVIPCYEEYFQTLEILPALKSTVRPSLPLQASRGCRYGKCRFCAVNPNDIPYRIRPAGEILKEIEHLSEEYKVEHFAFLDTMLDPSYFDDLIPKIIDLDAPYILFFEVSSHMSQEQFAKLRQAGVYYCQPGIENLHSAALKAMGKGMEAYKNLETLKWCRQFGIHVFWGFLHGFPGEQDRWYEEIADFIPLLEHLNPPLALGKIDYERGSDYFQRSSAYGLQLIPPAVQELMYPLQPDELDQYLPILYNADEAYRNQDMVLHRAGLQKLKYAINNWQRNFRKEPPAILSMIIDDREVHIKDTRSIATAPTFCLTGLAKDIFLACTLAQEKTELKNMYKEKGFPCSVIDFTIDNLLANHLMLYIDGRYLALAVEEPVMEYRNMKDNPMGPYHQG